MYIAYGSNSENLRRCFQFPDLVSKMPIMRKIPTIRLVTEMGDEVHHLKIAKEKKRGLTIKTVEQAIEAATSMHGMHFHVNPRTAHAERTKWAKRNFPEIAADLDMAWGAYGDLGYNGLDGKRAREAIESMERIINGIEGRTGLKFT